MPIRPHNTNDDEKAAIPFPSSIATPSSTVVDKARRFWWIHLPIILAMSTMTCLVLNELKVDQVAGIAFYHFLYLLPVPYVVLTILGLSIPASKLPAAESRDVDRLIICLVTKGTSPDVISRTYHRLLPLVTEGVELQVVTDVQLDLPHILVPPEFHPEHARYKARALEYFRQQQQFGPNDWVLHLDEESVLDQHGLQACLDFCRRSPYLYGQGVIFYNNHNFWRHPILAAADCIRAGDDMAKFHLQFAGLHWPIFGLHGSFLLVKGSLADEITWDLQGSLVEDYAFAIECMNRGLGVGEIRGIVREQSPHSIPDFLRQRRRWLVGIRGLSRLSPWARFWSVLWSASPLVKMATIANVLLDRHLPLELIIVGSFLICTSLYVYMLGSILQDRDCRSPPGTLLGRLIFTAVVFPISSGLESLAVVWSLVSTERRIGFQTVRK